MRFEYFEDKAGSWRWRLVAKNGRVVADGGEGYHSQGNARRAVKAFRTQVGDARHVILLKEKVAE